VAKFLAAEFYETDNAMLQQEVDFLDSCIVVLPKFNGKLSDRKETTQYKFDRQSRVQIAFDQISLWLRQQEIWVRDILSSLMRTQKRAEMTELHFHSLFSAISEARC